MKIRVTELVAQIVDRDVDDSLNDEDFAAEIERQREEREDREILGITEVTWRTLP